MSSDDTGFLDNYFTTMLDVFFTHWFRKTHKVDQAALDMSILASCKHAIFDYGTYGFWSSYLTMGKVVVPALRNGTELLGSMVPTAERIAGWETLEVDSSMIITEKDFYIS